MKKWGIIGALSIEVETIKNSLHNVHQIKVGSNTFYTGNIDTSEVVVCECSIGTVNAACTTQMMIDHFGVECVINTGIAGALHESLRVLDVVLSQSVVYHDRADKEIMLKYPPFAVEFAADALLLEKAQQVIAAQSNKDYHSYVGKIATGDVFVSQKDVKQDIIRRLSPYCVEMEGAAIGQVAFMNSIPFLVIRTMSDCADEEAEETYDNFMERAAANSAAIVLGMISK